MKTKVIYSGTPNKTIIDSARIHTKLEKVDTTNSAIGRAGKWINDLDIVTGKEKKVTFQNLPVKEGFKQKLKCSKVEVMRTDKGHIIYNEVVTQFVNSKMIGQQYFKGLTKETIQLAFNFNNDIEHNARIQFDDYLNSEVSDIDLTRDIETNEETFKRGTLDIAEILSRENIKHIRYKHTGNIEIGERDSGKPHITIYWKDAEIEKTAKKQWKEYNRTLNENVIHSYFEELTEVKTNVARIEVNMTSGQGKQADARAWNKAGFKKPETLKELIERNDSGEFNEIPFEAINKFYMEKDRKSTAETGLLKPTDYLIIKLMKEGIRRGMTLEQIESIAEDYQYRAGAKKSDASKLRSRIKAMIEEVKRWPTDEDRKKELLKEAEENPLLKAIGFKRWIV